MKSARVSLTGNAEEMVNTPEKVSRIGKINMVRMTKSDEPTNVRVSLVRIEMSVRMTSS